MVRHDWATKHSTGAHYTHTPTHKHTLTEFQFVLQSPQTLRTRNQASSKVAFPTWSHSREEKVQAVPEPEAGLMEAKVWPDLYKGWWGYKNTFERVRKASAHLLAPSGRQHGLRTLSGPSSPLQPLSPLEMRVGLSSHQPCSPPDRIGDNGVLPGIGTKIRKPSPASWYSTML